MLGSVDTVFVAESGRISGGASASFVGFGGRAGAGFGGFFTRITTAVDTVFDAGGFLGFFTIVPAFERADEVAGDATEAFERNVTFFPTARGTAGTRDDTGETADGIAVDGVID